eukprot:TRINITY_DN19152_c0_g1_i3.p1 TRINITY_DN19152_c0_g1~~TRINITY_DN19152_c0_g1_i3.p1  ORF type:complete len:1079 (-),score=446.83 TRINITY_DN19152_c0_g1_i3:74-3310(-)
MGKKAIQQNIPGMGPPEPKAPPKPKAPKAAAPPAKAAEEKAPAPPAPKAAAKAKAQAEPKASPKAAPKPDPVKEQAPKAAAAPKAAGKAAAKAATAPAASNGQPKASPKKAAGKAAAAPAPAPEPPVPEAKAAGKKKKKKEPEPPPPDPEPEVYKKTRRGGAKKKKAIDDDTRVKIDAHEQAVANKLAEQTAEQDEDYQAMKTKLQTAERPIKQGGATFALRKEIEMINDEIDKLIAAKKAKAPKATGPSVALAQSVTELEELAGTDEEDPEMLEDILKQLEDAKAAEVFNALKTKLLALKARCEKAVISLASVRAPKGGDEGPKGPSPVEEEKKEAAALRRLAALHGKEEGEIPASSIFKKTVELEADMMKYLFTPPFYFNSKFERNHLVVVESNRPPKGAGKGALAKDLTLIGASAAAVEKCAAALKSFDVSCPQTKEVDFGYTKTKEIESRLNVVVFKQRNSTSVFGKKEDVEAAFKMSTEKVVPAAQLTETMTIQNSKVKAMLPLLNGWRILSGATIKVNQPAEEHQDKPGYPAKVVISAKTQEEVDAAKQKVRDFDASLAVDFAAGDCAKLLQNRSAFREACSAHPDVQVERQETGFSLMGKAADVKAIKEKFADLFKQTGREPITYSLSSEHMRVFYRDNLVEISNNTGADVRKARDNSGLVISGPEEAVEQAKAAIAEVLKNEGSSDTVDVSEDLLRVLLLSRGAKISEIERQSGVSLNIDKKEGKVSLMGSPSGLEAAKSKLTELQAAIDKEIAETKMDEVVVSSWLVRYIIGPKGATLKKIRDECGVKVDIRDGDDEMSHAEIKGKHDDVEKAKRMIEEILAEQDVTTKPKAAPKAKTAASPKRPAKKAAEYKAETNDFPTLGGDAPVNGKAAAPGGAWGKKAEKQEAKAKEGSSANNFPTLGAATNGKSKEAAPQVEEADDLDPFAMMSGMGEEVVYKESLSIKPTEGASKVIDVAEEEEEEVVEEEKPKFVESASEGEDEDEDGEVDPFAMMGGMGAEVVYKESLSIEPTEGASKVIDVEEEEEEVVEEEKKAAFVESEAEEEEEEEKPAQPSKAMSWAERARSAAK